MGKVDHESLENQPGEGVVQIERVAHDNSNETAATAIDLEPDNESKEEEKETKDIGVANKDIDKQTEIIPDLNNVVGKTLIIEEEAAKVKPKPAASSGDTVSSGCLVIDWKVFGGCLNMNRVFGKIFLVYK